MNRGTRKVGKYEVGRTIGEGNFAKVKFAQNLETGENVAVKVMAKSTILKHKMVNQVYKDYSFPMIYLYLGILLYSLCYSICVARFHAIVKYLVFRLVINGNSMHTEICGMKN